MALSVLVTGASGFIGSRICRAFAENSWSVGAMLRESSATTELEKLNVPHRVFRVSESYDSIREALAAAAPDVIVHAASLFLSAHSAAQIDPLVRSNLLFGTWLLEAATAQGVRYFVNAASSWQHFSESDPAPANLYAAMKCAFENVIDYQCACRDLAAVSLTIFDSYGPGDARPKLIPLLLSHFHSGEALPMSPGLQRLDFAHVDDIAQAFVQGARLVSEMQPLHRRFSLRSSSTVNLRELVALLERHTGRPFPVRFGERSYRPRELMEPWTPHEPLPGWEPRRALEEGLREVLQFAGIPVIPPSPV